MKLLGSPPKRQPSQLQREIEEQPDALATLLEVGPNLSYRLAYLCHGGLPEWISPIVAIAPGQLWAKALAEAKGLDPDAPRGLSKVTLTH